MKIKKILISPQEIKESLTGLEVANAIQEGINILDTDYIYIQYSDLEYDHLQSLKMMNYAIENNLDVVLGSRLVTENMKK